MDTSRIDVVVEALIRARRDNTVALAAPLADALRDAGDAYAVQQRVAEEIGWFSNSPPRYWKAGGPSRDA